MHGKCFSFSYPWITLSFLYKETSHFDIRILEQNLSLSLSQIILLEISIKKNFMWLLQISLLEQKIIIIIFFLFSIICNNLR